ncbi:MAG: YARHG domain-containing protein [Pyrinomonadaceae bacterium]
MKIKNLTCLVFLLLFVAGTFAQDKDPRQERWDQFTKQGWQKVDFTKTTIRQAQLKKMDTEEPDEFDETQPVSQLALLRGIVFGKRGRIFKERSIQDYLEKQKWYKPNENFGNSVLTKKERENLDLIRMEEARRHYTVQPGDMRIWENKLIPEDKLGGYSAAELRVLIAEVEAIHGKTFPDEEWLQKYFNERYWYRSDPNYSQTVLSDIERKNIELLFNEKSKGRNTAISIGDMENFQTVALTDEQLNGLTMMELRMIRNEIWARRGLRFQTPGVRQYFEWRDWYRPLKDQSKVKLNDIERQNVNLILARENKMRENLATEVLSLETIENLFTEDLRILRNEIYARRGRVFKNPELQKYFEAQSWYKADPEFKDDMLGEVEFKNLATIKEAEEYAISKFAEFEG